MRISLDTQLTTPQAVGVRGGITSARLVGRGARLADLHQRVAEAVDAGLLPHVTLGRAPDLVVAAVARGASWQRRGKGATDRVVVVGEPGAVAAARVLAAPAPQGALAWVDQPDGGLVRAALDGARRVHLVVLGGPPWVPQLAAALEPEVARCTAFVEPGDDALGALSRAEVIEAPGAADPRFGAVGPAALALAGWAGADGELLAAALSEAAERCTALGVRANPALRLAVLADDLARQHGLILPVLMVGTGNLARWASWAQRAWAATTARQVPVPGGVQPRGAAPLVLRLGDEALVQRVVAGPRDLWGLALQVDPDPAAPLDDLAAVLLQAQVRQLVRDGRPVATLRLRDDGRATLAQLAWLWAHAALLAAALDPVDPLTMDAADDLRQLLAEDAPT